MSTNRLLSILGLVALTLLAQLGCGDSKTPVEPGEVPTITSFSPTSGRAGTVVTIVGTGFNAQGWQSVKFNGSEALILAFTTTELKVAVPQKATTGPISVSTTGGTAFSVDAFTVLKPPAPPVITDFSPTNGPVGTTVTITGSGFAEVPTDNTVTIGGGLATVNTVTTTQMTVVVPVTAKTGPISVSTVLGSYTTTSNFTVADLPNAPTNVVATAGTTDVTIDWTLVSGATGYNIYRATAPGVTPIPANLITPSPVTTKPYTDSGLTTGTTYYYVVTAVNGNGESQPSKVVSVVPSPPPPAPPIFNSFSPTSGGIGASVQITGANFSPIATNNTVTFGSGVPALVNAATETSLTVTVPAGATTGLITVTTAAGTATSATAFSVLLPPKAPGGVTAIAVTSTSINLDWSVVSGATGYNIYRSTTPGVIVAPANLLTTPPWTTPPYADTGLTTGLAYHYVVTAVGSTGESIRSAEVSATPTTPPPAPPTITGFGPTNGTVGTAVTITGTNFSSVPSNNTVVFGGGVPAIVTAATTTSLTATVPVGAKTGEITLTTAAGTAKSAAAFNVLLPTNPPSSVTAIANSPTSINLNWGVVSGATSYNVYRTTAPGVTVAPGNLVGAALSTPPFANTGLTTGVTYYYVVTSINANGESAASKEVSATPTTPPPSPPVISGFSPTNGTVGSAVVITGSNFSALPSNNTVAFNGTTAVVGTASTTSLTVSVPLGATTGKITVITAAGMATSVASFSVLQPPARPDKVTAIAVSATSINLSWAVVSGATSYNIYRSTGPGVTVTPGNLVSSPSAAAYSNTGLTTGITYYYVVTAVNANGEGLPSAEVSATPATPPPLPPVVSGFSPTNGIVGTTVVITGNYFSALATNNTVAFNGTTAVVTAATTTSLTVTVPAGATTGKVTVITAAGMATSTASFSVLQAPAPPTGVNASVVSTTAVTISWTGSAGATGYNVYRSTAPGVALAAPLNGGTPLANPPYNDNGLTPGQIYYYVVTALNANGESGASQEVSVLVPTVLPAPGSVTAVPGVGEVKLSWAPVSGATSYNIYYSTGATPPTTGSTKIANATSPYTHNNLTTNLQYNYVVTAVNTTGESAPSSPVSATPALPLIVGRLVGGISQTILQSNVEISVKNNFAVAMSNATVTMNGTNLPYDSARSIYKGYVNVAAGATIALSVEINGGTYAIPAGATQFTSPPAITAPASGSTWGPVGPQCPSPCSLDVTWIAGAPLPATYNYGIIFFDTVSVNPYWANSIYWNNFLAPGLLSSQVPKATIPINKNLALFVYINRTETITVGGTSGGTSVGSIDIISASPAVTITTL